MTQKRTITFLFLTFLFSCCGFQPPEKTKKTIMGHLNIGGYHSSRHYFRKELSQQLKKANILTFRNRVPKAQELVSYIQKLAAQKVDMIFLSSYYKNLSIQHIDEAMEILIENEIPFIYVAEYHTLDETHPSFLEHASAVIGYNYKEEMKLAVHELGKRLPEKANILVVPAGPAWLKNTRTSFYGEEMKKHPGFQFHITRNWVNSKSAIGRNIDRFYTGEEGIKLDAVLSFYAFGFLDTKDEVMKHKGDRELLRIGLNGMKEGFQALNNNEVDIIVGNQDDFIREIINAIFTVKKGGKYPKPVNIQPRVFTQADINQ